LTAGFLAIVSTLCLSARPGRAADQGDSVVATVAGAEIRASDIRRLLATLDPAQRKAVASNLDALTELVRRRSDQLAVIKEAEARHWDSDPAAQAQIARARDDALAASYLASISKPPDGYPSDADIQAAYALNKNKLVRPEQYELEQLSVARPAGADKATEDKLVQFVSQIDKAAREKGASLEKLAQAKSKEAKGAGDFAVTYRDLGFVGGDQLDPALRPIVKALNIGGVSNVLALPTEYALLRLRDLKPETPLRYEEVRDQLADALRRQKIADEEQAAMKRIVAGTPIAIDQISLRKLIDAR
jgi:peptidylprolyl isomerase